MNENNKRRKTSRGLENTLESSKKLFRIPRRKQTGKEDKSHLERDTKLDSPTEVRTIQVRQEINPNSKGK